MIMSILLILFHKSHFTNLPLAFLFIYNLIEHWKFNNMHFMNLFILSDFMQALNINRNHYNKNDYFSRHTLFSTIYLL
jgi:hypothetical protein